jgi:hypothetical protein
MARHKINDLTVRSLHSAGSLPHGYQRLPHRSDICRRSTPIIFCSNLKLLRNVKQPPGGTGTGPRPRGGSAPETAEPRSWSKKEDRGDNDIRLRARYRLLQSRDLAGSHGPRSRHLRDKLLKSGSRSRHCCGSHGNCCKTAGFEPFWLRAQVNASLASASLIFQQNWVRFAKIGRIRPILTSVGSRTFQNVAGNLCDLRLRWRIERRGNCCGISNDVRPSLPRDCWQNWRFVSVSAELGGKSRSANFRFLMLLLGDTISW